MSRGLQLANLRILQCHPRRTMSLGKPTRKKSAVFFTLVAGAWTERQKMFHGGSFLKLADDNMDIQNPEAQNRELSGF